jgi:hypothetical protein
VDARGAPVSVRVRRAARPAWCAAALLVLALVTSAHVGTLDTFFAGKAGPWGVQVTVRPPGVVPGRAQILVRVSPTTATKVSVQAAQWDLGELGAPPADRAVPVPGAPGLWSAELWLMTSGSYGVNVVVDGPSGVGAVKVPVASLATKRLDMQRPLGFALLALGAFLAVGLVSIVGSAAREGALVPGEAPDARTERRARRAMAVAAVVLIAALTGGWTWWNAVDRGYARGMYRPLHATPSVRTVDGARVLRLVVDDERWRERQLTPIVPDHGKIMHLFLVRAPALDAFAHLHPTLVDSSTFDASLGALPAGRYRAYADIVHESGLAETLVATVDVGAPGEARAFADPDDAMHVGGVARGETATLDDGTRVMWRRPGRLTARADAPLVFEVRTSDGAPAQLEPYMGMGAHAMVSREDGAVFMHLHPMGSISLTAQAVLDAIDRGDTLPATPALRVPRPVLRADSAMTMTATDGVLSFPFAFPEPGRYRIWVQFRRPGRGVETVAYDAVVGE